MSIFSFRAGARTGVSWRPGGGGWIRGGLVCAACLGLTASLLAAPDQPLLPTDSTLSVPVQGVEQSAAQTSDLRSAAQADNRLLPSRAAIADQSKRLEGRAASLPAPAIDEPPPYTPTEFETYVRARRLGANLIAPAQGPGVVQDPLASVPADYVIKPGDEISLTIWGSVDADLRLVVDRSGQVSIPRVGAVRVAGVRHGDLSTVLGRRVGQFFKGFQLSASLGQLRAIRVYATGFVQRPGSLTVSSLSSVLNVLMRAGGPTAAGSFRDIELRRAGQTVAHFDLYDFLLHGNRGADQIVQSDDVIHVGPIGAQVALLGSVNQPGVFELQPGETLADLLAMGGGFSAVADTNRLTIERLADRATGRVAQISISDGRAAQTALASGDVLRVFNVITVTPSKERQNKRVRLEGEVARPGDYLLPPGSTLADALKVAGGLTPLAYLYATEFTRETERISQQENYDRALRDLETDMLRSQVSRGNTSTESAALQKNAERSNMQLIDKLRTLRPTGRIVLGLAPGAKELPDLVLEDGDRLHIVPQATSVSVFGSVYNAGSFIYEPQKAIGDYLSQAGGPTRGADARSMFVIRADGTVASARQNSAFWGLSSTFSNITALPGDTIFVPEELVLGSFTQSVKDWTQILYQFGLGVAGIKALGL